MSAQQVLIVSSHCVLRHNSKLTPSPLYPNNIRCASSKERDNLKILKWQHVEAVPLVLALV